MAPSVQFRSLADADYFDCRAVTLLRRENPLKFEGVPQTGKPISAASGPKFTILWWGHLEEVLMFNKFFFRLSIHELVPKI